MFHGMMGRKLWDPGGLGYAFTMAKFGKCDPLPPDVAGIECVAEGRGLFAGNKKVHVTWAEVMRRRRERQAEELKRKRCDDYIVEKRAVRVEVFYNPHWIYQGWHTYLTIFGEEPEWVRRNGVRESAKGNPYNLLTIFPIADPKYRLFGPVTDYEKWMPLFARLYQRGKKGGRFRGVRYCWGMCRGTSVEELLPL